MKLFDDMTPAEKLAHVEACMADALKHLKAEHGPIYLANILDVWDYWTPYLIERCRKLEAIAEAANDVAYRCAYLRQRPGRLGETTESEALNDLGDKLAALEETP